MAPSIRELKSILQRRGVDFSGAIEKVDLEELVAKTAHVDGKTVQSTSQEVNQRTTAHSRAHSQLTEAAAFLGVTPDAPEEVVAAAQRALMKMHHPDRNRSNADEHEALFKQAKAAGDWMLSVPRAQRRAALRAVQQQHERGLHEAGPSVQSDGHQRGPSSDVAAGRAALMKPTVQRQHTVSTQARCACTGTPQAACTSAEGENAACSRAACGPNVGGGTSIFADCRQVHMHQHQHSHLHVHPNAPLPEVMAAGGAPQSQRQGQMAEGPEVTGRQEQDAIITDACSCVAYSYIVTQALIGKCLDFFEFGTSKRERESWG